MATALSRTFRSLKPHSNTIVLPIAKTYSSEFPPNILPQVQSPKKPSSPATKSPTKNPWTVYLIISTNPPIKTYVGVTNHFSRRLKQHNGELIGGAKASTAGRPWTCACLIQGFVDKSKGN
ncbi:structure-specific endonuclease subunit SLX1-like [Salvia divinorum]|uniref:Structure-specific endonuclease subunit SLX1-like n=1 Tax=Salvia divinorum TaxID=28513 RepID=A0ABD1GMJ4_SALDI